MMIRLLATVFLCSLGIGAIMTTTPEVDRTDAELCAEVAREVETSAEQGLLTLQEAKSITDRCYLLYGGK